MIQYVTKGVIYFIIHCIGSQCADVKEWTVFKFSGGLSNTNVPDIEACRSFCQAWDACEGFWYQAANKQCSARSNIAIGGERTYSGFWHSGLRECEGKFFRAYYQQ